MKYRIIAVFVLSILALNTFADTKAKKSNGSELVALLPASDGVVVLDVRRFFNDALPKLMSSNQPMLARVNGEIDKFKSKTGLDIRQFESIAAGVATKNVGVKKYDVDPVIIARGQMSAEALIGAAKLAANGKYKEERVGERTIYVFSGAALAKDTPAADKMSHDIAVTIVDSTTIAFGSLDRVRQTVEGRTKVGVDITSLLDRAPNAVTSFAAKTPAGIKSFIPYDNDELGKNIDSIQYVYGNADVAGDLANLQMTARTTQNAQAKSLHETLAGLKMLGKAFLGGAKGDKQVFGRLIDNVKFGVKANEVTMDLQVPQSDIDLLVGQIK